MTTRKTMLVLCTGNSCRSQMAEGYLRHFAGEKVIVYSAGIETHGVNPRAIAVMQEDGIDLSGHTSNHIDEYLHLSIYLVLTVCDHARESCPFLPAKKIIHHSFSDPAKETGTESEIMDSFRKVRDEIKIYCRQLIEQHF